jgi:hypothetical protein
MNSVEKRQRVYYSWVVFRHLTFNAARIAGIINTHGIGLTLIVGKYDKAITPANMQRLTNRVNDFRLEILESGHSGLINQSLPFFMEMEKE